MTSREKSAVAFLIERIEDLAKKLATAEAKAEESHKDAHPDSHAARMLGALSFHVEQAAKELEIHVDMARKAMPAVAKHVDEMRALLAKKAA